MDDVIFKPPGLELPALDRSVVVICCLAHIQILKVQNIILRLCCFMFILNALCPLSMCLSLSSVVFCGSFVNGANGLNPQFQCR